MTENGNATVLVLVGSLRAASVNRQLAELAAESAPAGVQVTIFDRLGEVPFYNEDIDGPTAPEPAQALREGQAVHLQSQDGLVAALPVHGSPRPVTEFWPVVAPLAPLKPAT